MAPGQLMDYILDRPNPDKPEPKRFEDKKNKKMITKARKYEDTKA
jgi:hypothetical protein